MQMQWRAFKPAALSRREEKLPISQGGTALQLPI